LTGQTAVADADLLAAPPLPAGRRIALVIANSAYASAGYQDLPAPAQDAKIMTELLADKDICGFEVRTIVNASGERMRREINALYNGRVRGEFVLVYFSGHGVRDDSGRLHLVASDTDPEMVPATGVPARFLMDLSQASVAGQQLIIFDCCFSGAYDVKGVGLADMVGLDRPASEATVRGRCVITASRGAEYSFQYRLPSGKVTGSMLTVALVEGIRTGGADVANNGRITAADAYRYAHAAVTERSKKQNPQFAIAGGEGASIQLARNPVGIRVGGEGMYELIATLDSPHPNLRRAAVQTLGELLLDVNPAKAVAARRRLQTLAGDGADPLAQLAGAFLESAAPVKGFKAWRRNRPFTPPSGTHPAGPAQWHEVRSGRPPFGDGPSDAEFERPDPRPPFPSTDDEAMPPPPEDELDGLPPVEDPLGVFGGPPARFDSEPSRTVARYLYPTERYRYETRRHWIGPVTALMIAGWCAGRARLTRPGALPFVPDRLSDTLPPGVLRWGLWLIAAVLLYRAVGWFVWRMTLTNRQVMIVRGLLWRRTMTIPLDRVVDAGLSLSPLGRALDYGTLRLSTGTWRTYRIRRLPNPHDTWLRFVEERFEPAAVEARLGYVDPTYDES
jgi:uncharacterized caspase-like protein